MPLLRQPAAQPGRGVRRRGAAQYPGGGAVAAIRRRVPRAWRRDRAAAGGRAGAAEDSIAAGAAAGHRRRRRAAGAGDYFGHRSERGRRSHRAVPGEAAQTAGRESQSHRHGHPGGQRDRARRRKHHEPRVAGAARAVSSTFERLKGKVGFVSLGCPKNLVDTEVMMGLLQRQGWEITAQAEDADVLVVNTCSFIEPAQRESVDTILELAELKKTGKAKRLVVAGCMVERFRGDIRAEMPEVDALIGTDQLEQIAAACAGSVAAAGAGLLPVLPQDFFDPTPSPPFLYDDLTPRLRATARHSAYVKIAEGCDHPCSFCVIPQYRGKFRSRRFESVVAEVARLAQEGAREVVLIGQDTTCYGDDLGLKNGLSALLARLGEVAAASEGLRWVRTLYFYPNRVTQPLLDTIAAHAGLCKYVDMPLQHAAAPVLKRMKRGGSGEIFLKLIERMRRTIPGVAL